MKFLTLTIAFLFSSLSLFSQITAKGASAPGPENISVISLDNADWSFYADEDDRTFYVDFEKINFNLCDVNAIYELNFEEYGIGDYTVELRSFTKIIRKDISIR